MRRAHHVIISACDEHGIHIELQDPGGNTFAMATFDLQGAALFAKSVIETVDDELARGNSLQHVKCEGHG